MSKGGKLFAPSSMLLFRRAMQSSVFKDMFLSPTGDENDVEGMCDEKPVRLEGVDNPSVNWEGAIALADMWDFPQVRATAINGLGKLPLDVVEKPSYIDLAMRHASPTAEEASRMGIKFTVKIFQVREKMLRDEISLRDQPHRAHMHEPPTAARQIFVFGGTNRNTSATPSPQTLAYAVGSQQSAVDSFWRYLAPIWNADRDR
ncbi:hypothetical protein BD410DRAFT_858951 [Rickenella mellea]|uniref:Uncharacterized protein n=1 Tax=Rickenella mellea TaxID=50990 RepID=A0A4Y7PGM7_9AGAM|nr:hypothetical protein BD410DRAFT_858951 [Rickenella mellea]